MKESFYEKVLPAQVILIDSVNRKDGNCYSKVFLERYFLFELKNILMVLKNSNK